MLCLVTQSCPTLCNPAKCLCPWGFSRQEYWSGLPYPPPGDLPYTGIEPRSPALQADSLSSEPPGKLEEYWSGLPCPPPGDLPYPGTEPRSSALQVDSLPSEPLGKPLLIYTCFDPPLDKPHLMGCSRVFKIYLLALFTRQIPQINKEEGLPLPGDSPWAPCHCQQAVAYLDAPLILKLCLGNQERFRQEHL